MAIGGTRKALLLLGLVFGVLGVVLASVPFLVSLGPSEAVRARLGNTTTVDVSALKVGKLIKVGWQGLPIVILRRDPADVVRLAELNHRLFDPYSEVDPDAAYIKKVYRSIRPEYFVAINVSTYCGCTLTYKEEWYDYRFPGGVFFDPCHVGTYDAAGRLLSEAVAKPTGAACSDRMSNLRLPPYRFQSDEEIVIGEAPS